MLRSAHVRLCSKVSDCAGKVRDAPAVHVHTAKARRALAAELDSDILHCGLTRHTTGHARAGGAHSGPLMSLAYLRHSLDVACNLADDGAYVVLVSSDPVLACEQTEAGGVAVAAATDGGGPHWCQLVTPDW